jgi:hypothetical protein
MSARVPVSPVVAVQVTALMMLARAWYGRRVFAVGVVAVVVGGPLEHIRAAGLLLVVGTSNR